MKRLLRYILLFFITVTFIPIAHAQERTIHGVVKAKDTGETLPGVNILVKGTNQGTSTNTDGEFQISVSNGETLVFSAVGFKKHQVQITDQKTLNIQMEPAVGQLEEMVVIGYGEQSRNTLTTSASKLDTKVLDNVTLANPMSALEGNISGLRVQTTSGQPGEAPNIVLRGGSSITNPEGANPLYIVDGVIRQNLNDLNPDNIASMQVLKDAAATAIYGARASNGVIIVTTKTGQPGDTKIEYKYSLGVSQLQQKMDIVSAHDYVYYGRLGMAATAEQYPQFSSRLDMPIGFGIGNDMTKNTYFTPQYLGSGESVPGGWQSMPDPLDSSKTIIYKNTDWQDVLFRPAITHNNYISVSGGGTKARFDAGIGYLTNQGIAISTGYDRLTTHLNADLQVLDNLRVFGKVNFSNSSTNRVYSTSEIFRRSLSLPPTAKYKFQDGTYAPGQNISMGNPKYYLPKLDREDSRNKLTLAFNADWSILPNKLSFQPSASLYMNDYIRNSFNEAYQSGSNFVDSRNAEGYHSLYWQRQADGVFTYHDTYGRYNNVQLKVGGSYYDRQIYNLDAQGKGAASDKIPTLNAAAEPTDVSSSTSKMVIAGYFGRLTYDYNKKYLLAASLRMDGASNFGQNNHWGYFPGVSAGWNIHNEPFWKPMLPVVDRLKLRASYGVTGNNSGISDYHAQGEYRVGYKYEGSSAILNQRMANPNLKWERTATMDAGVDLGLFDSRLTFLFDYYYRETSNILWDLRLPHSTGFSSIKTNLATLANRGYELEMKTDLIRKRNLVWNASFNVSYNQNKIMKLPENDNKNNRIGGIYIYDPRKGDYVWAGGYQEGGTIGQMYAYQQKYIYPTDKAAQKGPTDMLVNSPSHQKGGGDVAWLDVDNNGVIDSRDQVYQGNSIPPWTGGFRTNVTYKGVGLTVAMDYAVGHTIYNWTRAKQNGQLQGDIAPSSDILRSWQHQGDKTDVARYYWADQFWKQNIWRGNSYYYEKGDYLALREISLSYVLPQRWVGMFGVQQLKTYVSGRNLHYFTAYRGLLPEQGGTDSGRYPNPRTFTFGVNISF